MRLFHVSEDENIKSFIPRLPERDDLDKNVGLVWAIDETRLLNFLTPRDCPRVAYHVGKNTSEIDRNKFFTSKSSSFAVVIENKWFDKMRNTILYLYEFNTADFELLDDVAGYYVAQTEQFPIAKYRLDDLFGELIKRNVEVRITDNLWCLADEIKESTLNWSLCRMRNAQPRIDKQTEQVELVG